MKPTLGMRSGELERSARLGEYFFQVGRKSLGHHPSVGDVCGKGLVMGIELVRNKRTKEPFPPKLKAGNRFQQIAMSHGCMVYPTFMVDHCTRGDQYLVSAQYIIDEEQIDEAFAMLDAAQTDFEREFLTQLTCARCLRRRHRFDKRKYVYR